VTAKTTVGPSNGHAESSNVNPCGQRDGYGQRAVGIRGFDVSGRIARTDEFLVGDQGRDKRRRADHHDRAADHQSRSVTIYLNRTILGPGDTITRRALEVSAPALGTDVVAGEAIADVESCDPVVPDPGKD
jgi:hypothetical protein